MSETKLNKGLYVVVFLLALMGALIGAALGLFWTRGAKSPAAISPQGGKVASGQLSVASKTLLASEHSSPTTSVIDEITETRRNAIVRAAEKIGPAVVSISVVQVRTVRESPFGSPFGDQFFDEFWGRYFQPREYKQKVYSLGSGVIINEDGYILTNEHVVRGADELKVTLTDGKEYKGKIVGQDHTSDLAVVKIEGRRFPYAPLGDSDSLIIGEWAIALGNPFGYLLDDPHPTVTVGVISALNRDIKMDPQEGRSYRKMIQTDAAINPGNSGGPLVDANGQVVGINTFIFSTSRGSEGIGFAIPIDRAKNIISDLISKGKVVKGWVGIKVQDLTQLLASSLGIEEKEGVIITEVDKGSPAEKAQIKRGDLITVINGEKVRNKADFQGITSYVKPQDKLEISYIRDKKVIQAEVSAQKEPTVKVAEEKEDFLGITVSEISSSLAEQLSLTSKAGVVITAVDEGGKGEGLGLREGDVIREVNNQKVKNMEDYKKLIANVRNQRRLVMVIEREGGMYVVSVTL
jgi:serine protease Do